MVSIEDDIRVQHRHAFVLIAHPESEEHGTRRGDMPAIPWVGREVAGTQLYKDLDVGGLQVDAPGDFVERVRLPPLFAGVIGLTHLFRRVGKGV